MNTNTTHQPVPTPVTFHLAPGFPLMWEACEDLTFDQAADIIRMIIEDHVAENEATGEGYDHLTDDMIHTLTTGEITVELIDSHLKEICDMIDDMDDVVFRDQIAEDLWRERNR